MEILYSVIIAVVMSLVGVGVAALISKYKWVTPYKNILIEIGNLVAVIIASYSDRVLTDEEKININKELMDVIERIKEVVSNLPEIEKEIGVDTKEVR